MGFSARAMAGYLGRDPTGFIRMEKGIWSPSQENARKLFDFYGRIVPSGMIHDTLHAQWRSWMTEHKQRRLQRRAVKLAATDERLRRSLDRSKSS